ncbi:putative late blight resistance protein homolog R1A-10 [Salvia hispanica]|uniref:putative late blight resistance protein homolog R1A-10 n=1 Tax=Salvia hispanica TaxID=49212 RepID=UPI002009AF00|nr:putative late blight resistance protein homolog R1A-10 [Salvia hispanica]
MAAYAAANSLMNTIQLILESPRLSLVPPSPKILQPAYDAMCCLQQNLQKLDETSSSKIRTKVNDLDERIKEAIWEFEDLLETCYTNQILPQLESSGGVRYQLSFSVDLQSLRQSVDCFVERVAVMEAEYDAELLNMPEEEGEPISLRIDFSGINSNMVGLTYEFERVREYLVEDEGKWVSVIGMAGVGKTTLAKKVFEDPSVQRHFELRAWVRMGRKCEFNEILRCILAQVDPNIRNQMLTKRDDGDDKKLVGLFEERLKDKRCLVVFDDVWEWDMQLMESLAKGNVQILLTSRIRMKHSFIVLPLLSDEESKKLLSEKVFGEDGFPPHLDELGEKIAKKCEGLPLVIVTVAELISIEHKIRTEEAQKQQLISKEDKILKFWIEVAEKQQHPVFVNAYDQIFEVLYPSYEYLPQHLKMLFLYLGTFPPYSNITMFYLTYQLSAEGFLKQNRDQTVESFIDQCSSDLVLRYNLVIARLSPDESSYSTDESRVHSCWQHLCKKIANKIKFLHVFQSCSDIIQDQRRLCVHSNSLFCFKEVYHSIKSNCASMTRSLLCYGPYHQYPVPIYAMDFKLLRVLYARRVRFYHFPLEILKLVCLKYLALTCNKELPSSISNLFHLQSLIIEQHMNIRKRGTLSYMPVEIWDMQELQHIEVIGRDLPTPNSGATLDKLMNLYGVTAKSCTSEILRRIPNLMRLGIDVELKPYDDSDDSNPLSGFDHISDELQNLTTFSFILLNPVMKLESMVSLSMFPSSLTELELGGLGCPWKHMNDIGSMLPNLKILQLRHYAFQGPEWNIESNCFLKLEKVQINDTDLVRLRAEHGSIPRLKYLGMHDCYKLQELNLARDPSMVTTEIELFDCNLLVIIPAKSMLTFEIYSSFYYSI